MTYYMWSRGRILPSKTYDMMKHKKGEYILLKVFAEIEMKEEREKIELNMEMAKAGINPAF